MGKIGALTRMVGRKSLSRGWRTGNGALLALGGSLAVIRFVRRVASRPDSPVTESLRPGETLVIESTAPERRRRRRRS